MLVRAFVSNYPKQGHCLVWLELPYTSNPTSVTLNPKPEAGPVHPTLFRQASASLHRVLKRGGFKGVCNPRF